MTFKSKSAARGFEKWPFFGKWATCAPQQPKKGLNAG